MRVLVAMSGGVDSSVAAYMLKKQGYDVEGVTLKMVTDFAHFDEKACCSEKDIQDAAAVAEATVGFAKEEHMPKGMIFFIGTLSMMVAAGMLEVRTLFSGVTTRLEGAAPKVHWHMAPMQT